jgi:hypothetical protein
MSLLSIVNLLFYNSGIDGFETVSGVTKNDEQVLRMRNGIDNRSCFHGLAVDPVKVQGGRV